MVMKIVAAIVGALLLGAGIYYYGKEKKDPESRKIYSIVSLLGFVILAASLALSITEMAG